MKKTLFIYLPFIVLVFIISGCTEKVGNSGQLQSYPFMMVEAIWIRNGEPLQFEGEEWYPADEVENLLDSEVYILGEYRGTQFFVEKYDVRPYSRLYTKFGTNQFRYFVKREKPHDKSL